MRRSMKGDEPMYRAVVTRTYPPNPDGWSEAQVAGFTTTEHAEHNLGVTPLVRYRERVDGSEGIILPLLVLQDRLNEAVFALLIALQYASHRQRWATGLAIPVDENETLPDGSPNPNYGQPIEPFESAVDRLWLTDNPDAKFGDFAQTDVKGHLRPSAWDPAFARVGHGQQPVPRCLGRPAARATPPLSTMSSV